MPMTAEEFIERLEFLGLLEEKILANLRRQVSESKKPVSPQTLAKLLVDQGHLTSFQAKKLVGDDSAPEAPPPSSKPAATATPATSTPPASKPASQPTKPPASSSAPAKPTFDASAGKKPATPTPAPVTKSVDDDLGLAPSDEDLPPAAKPAPAAASKPAEEEIVDLIAVNEPPPKTTEPARKAVTPQPPASAPALTPLAPLSGPAPVDLFAMPGPLGTSSTPASGYGSGQIPSNLTPAQPVDLFGGPLTDGGLSSSGPLSSSYVPGTATPGAYSPQGYTPSGYAPPGVPPAPIKKVRGSQWESPLLLLGGGGLLLLLIALGALYWVLTRGSADEILQQAEDDYRGQSYGAALANYEKFITNFPNDGKASLARVRRGMCKLRPLVESKSWSQALAEANKVLPEIEVEAQFSEARAELATLLPDIAAGFAAKARAETDTSKSQTFVDQAEDALKLVNNSSYIPTSMRVTSAVEPRILAIQEDVALARRDINRDKELARALGEIDAAVKAKKTPDAYAVRRELIKAYPDLELNADLRRAVLVITEGEREQVKSAFKAQDAVTEEEPSRSEFRVVLSANNGPGVSGVDGRVILVLARGAVYGLDAASGRVLWRRFVGFETKFHPQLLAKQPDSDALLVDGQRNEVLRVNAATGKLVWRLPLGEPFAGPIVGHDRVFVTTLSGRVVQIDPVAGQAVREAVFPQTLAVEPALDARGRVIFQMGEHSNVYVLKVDTLGCESVFYVGQKAGSVVVPPLLAQGYLFVAENAGPDYCLLHVISADSGDAGLKEAQAPLRLKGRVLVPLASAGRRVLVVTDLGEINLLEIDPANAKSPVSVPIRLGQTSREPMLSYPLADEGLLWVADRRVSKYEIQLSRSELVRKSVKDEGDTFIAPLERIGDALVHVRRRRNTTGVSVTAVQVDSDQTLWQTDLATPLAGPVQVDAAKNRFVAISAYAEFFGVEQPMLQSGLSGKPATVVGANAPGLTFTRIVELDGGKLVLASAVDNEKAVTYDPTAEFPTRVVKLAFPSGTAVAEPLAFAGGLLQPSNQGRVYLLNLQTGGNLVLPFQPRLSAGEAVEFSRPAVFGEGRNEFVVADNRKRLYRVGVKDQPQPHLSELAQVETAAEIVSPLAAVGSTLYGVSRTGTIDSLVAFQLPDLKSGTEKPLTGRVSWGPEQVGNVVFVSTDKDGLFCLEAGERERWKTPLPYGPLAGRPLADGDDFLLASQSGTVWRVAGDSGKELAKVDVGEPLGAGPVLFRGRLLLAGSDGVLHVVKSPVAAASP